MSKIVNKKRYRASGWEPTEDDRKNVIEWASVGQTASHIAQNIHSDGPISESTVRRKFNHELIEGKAKLMMKIIGQLHEQACKNCGPITVKLMPAICEHCFREEFKHKDTKFCPKVCKYFKDK
jgi:hypothetical protein